MSQKMLTVFMVAFLVLTMTQYNEVLTMEEKTVGEVKVQSKVIDG
ncbi:MAG: hypothetical protein QG641_1357, partial [Candidatus Poribacteria bacterium]|nr:hypothetical protein [Candidatus Poribacteria bacterium]